MFPESAEHGRGKGDFLMPRDLCIAESIPLFTKPFVSDRLYTKPMPLPPLCMSVGILLDTNRFMYNWLYTNNDEDAAG